MENMETVETQKIYLKSYVEVGMPKLLLADKCSPKTYHPSVFRNHKKIAQTHSSFNLVTK